MKNKRTWILVLLFFLSTINYLDRVVLSVSIKPISTEFGLSPVQLGYMFSSFLWLYVIFLVPMGMIVDRFGPRVVNATGIGLWSLATILTGFAGGFGSLVATRIAMGVGESTTYPAGNRVIREWMPASERGFAMSVFNSGAYFGPAVGAIVIGALVTTFGWRPAFYVCGLIGLVWLAVWLVWYRMPEKAGWLGTAEREFILRERNADGATAVAGPALGVSGLLGKRAMWAIMLTQGCAVYTQYLFLTWLPGYLQSQKGISIMASASLMALPYLGAVVLGILAGRVSDRLLSGTMVSGGRRRLMVGVMLLIGSVILFVPVVNSVELILVLITIALTGVSSAISLNFALLNDLVEAPADIGTATGIQVVGGNAFGIMAPIVTGYVISATGNYDLAFVIAGCLLVLGVVSALVFTRGTLAATA